MELFKSRTRVVYTNAVGDKVYPVIVDIKKGIKSTEEIQFMSSDINTGVLSVAFINGNVNFNLGGSTVLCSVMRPDTTTLEIPCIVVEGNIVEVPLGVNGTSQEGVYSFDFKIVKGDEKVIGTPTMYYSVALSIDSDMAVEDDDRLPVLTMLITQVNELKEETRETISQANLATEASREATVNAIEATNNANAVSERVSQETATAISEIKQDTENAIASMNQSVSNAISTMNQSATDAIASMNQSTTDALSNMTQKTDEALSNVNQNTTNAIANMTQETNEAITMVNDNLANINNVVTTKVAELDNAKSDMTTTVSNKVNEIETRFNTLTSSQQQSSEVIDARDGETSLKARLDRDIEKAKQVYVDVEGTNISTQSSIGYAKDVEIKGNTIQNAEDLADIRSVGDKVEGQELYEIPVVSCGKNLFNVTDVFNTQEEKDNYKWHVFKLKPNTKYIVSSALTRNNRVDMLLKVTDYEYTRTFGWLCHTDNANVADSISFTTDYQGRAGVAFKNVSNNDILNTLNSFFIYEGTVATEYEPYQEDKLTILSPVQLEKVGDVADRIICKDGVWGVEKNIKKVMLNSYSWSDYRITSTVGTPVLSFSTYFDGVKIHEKIICNKFLNSNVLTAQHEGIQSLADGLIYLSIFRNRLAQENLDGFNTWLNENELYIYLKNNAPQFIPLPHDQQIKLRTFAGQTNIHFETEIEGTIKAQVPKSIGASINTHTEQIANLNNELNRVKKLEESTVSTVETESNFTTVTETSNGYFDGVKLEGKTLVNLHPNTGWNNAEQNAHTKYVCNNLNPDMEYTLIVLDNNVEKVIDRTYLSSISSVKSSLIALHKCDSDGYGHVHVYPKSGCVIPAGYLDNVHIILLEGDHTQNPPSYFEGLLSAGQDVEEVSVESVNENLWDFNDEINLLSRVTINNMINSNYCLSFNSETVNGRVGVRVYKADGSTITNRFSFSSGYSEFTFNNYDNENVVFEFYSWDTGAVLSSITDIMLNIGDLPKPYTPHQSDRKHLLYYNPTTETWEKPVLRQWDTIEKHSDGKYYYHKRSGEVMLNGSESWNEVSCTSENISRFYVNVPYVKAGQFSIVCCDKFISHLEKVNSYTDIDIECIKSHPSSSALNIFILNSKLSTQDVAGFKAWLQANPTTVVYQLAQEEVYECTNIDLITYANETNYIVESGAISPKSTLKVHNNISNVVRLLQEKVSILENKFIQGLKQVLAGDMYSLATLLYPEDFETENNIMLLPLE